MEDTNKTDNNGPGGRPSKYKPEYCSQIIAFFDIPLSERVLKSHTTGKNEYEKDEYIDKPNPVPFFSKFARVIGVHVDTLNEWCKVYPEFSEAYNTCKDIQKEFLIGNGLSGLYPPASFIFTAKNITDMRDSQEVKHSGELTYREAMAQALTKREDADK